MATNQELITYYSNLLLAQYIGLPLATGMVESFVTPLVMDQFPNQILNGFEIGTAVGPQLDVIGKYVGVFRSGLGLSQQPITLNDIDFTTMIMIGIARNNLPNYTQAILGTYLLGPATNYDNNLFPQAGGFSLFAIDLFLQTFFQQNIFCYDNLDMTISYLITSSIAANSDLLQLIITQGLLPKPMGVGIALIIYYTTQGLFSMVSYSDFTIVSGVPVYDIPTWDIGTTYALGQEVYFNGVVYKSLNSGNVGNQPDTDPTDWVPLLFPATEYNGYSDYTQTPAFIDSWTWFSYSDTHTLGV